MAQKLQLLKLLQEIRGFAEAGNRMGEVRPLLHSSAALRPENSVTSLPRRRFSIPISHEVREDSPLSIPITSITPKTRSATRIMRIMLPANQAASVARSAASKNRHA